MTPPLLQREKCVSGNNNMFTQYAPSWRCPDRFQNQWQWRKLGLRTPVRGGAYASSSGPEACGTRGVVGGGGTGAAGSG